MVPLAQRISAGGLLALPAKVQRRAHDQQHRCLPHVHCAALEVIEPTVLLLSER
jgi:hypothetical protein